MATKKNTLLNILRELNNVGGVQGSAIISKDGLIIASDLSSRMDTDIFAAMSAAMQGAAETAVGELNLGKLTQISVETEKGRVMTKNVGNKAILVILASNNINLGLLLLEITKTSSKIVKVLK